MKMFGKKELPRINDRRGNLSFIENLSHIPFNIKRVYWIYDVPGGAMRGGHAYRKNEEFIVALSGSFDLILNDGKNETVIHLNRSYNGVYIPPMIWCSIGNFSTNSLALILASTDYDEDDYIKNFDLYVKEVESV